LIGNASVFNSSLTLRAAVSCGGHTVETCRGTVKFKNQPKFGILLINIFSRNITDGVLIPGAAASINGSESKSLN